MTAAVTMTGGTLAWTRPFVGVPYADRGRSFDGADCWGLVWLVYRHHRGITLPAYAGCYQSAEEQAEVGALIGRETHGPFWHRVDGGSRELDILLFRRGRLASHVGIFLRPGLMLHLAEDDCAKLERFDTAKWQRRLVDVFRRSAS